MSQIDDLIADAGLPLLLETMGESVAYLHDGNAAVPLTALVQRETVTETDGEDRRTLQKATSVTITNDSSSEFGGVADPQLNAQFTIGGETYEVAARSGAAGGFWVLTLKAVGLVERTRKNFRGRR